MTAAYALIAAGALLMGIGAVAIALTFKARKGDQ